MPSTNAAVIAYRAATFWVVATALWAGVTDLLHAPPLFDEVLRLGYPPHFATALGVWKVLGAVALSVPRMPLLKEWAYAGMFLDYTGAITAHASAGDGVVWFVAPTVSIAALATSWHLRPASRRLAGTRLHGILEQAEISDEISAGQRHTPSAAEKIGGRGSKE